MGALGIALVVVALILLVMLAIVILTRRRLPRGARYTPQAHPGAPAYTPQSEHTEYHRPREKGQEAGTHSPESMKRDPRLEPLPHCPLCYAAIGYEDKRCSKCGHILREL